MTNTQAEPWISRACFLIALTSLALLASCSQTQVVLVGSYSSIDHDLRVIFSQGGDGGARYSIPLTGEVGLLRRAEDGGWVSNGRMRATGPDRVRVLEEGGRVQWTADGVSTLLQRDAVRIIEAEVESSGVMLALRLYLPPGSGPHPGIVVVHGSETTSAIQNFTTGWLLAPENFAVAVFDKRGTGASEGVITQSFSVLAQDVAVVARWMQNRAEVSVGKLALVGFSQGGWVAPLAAAGIQGLTGVQVLYGFAESPFTEDLRQCRLDVLGDAELSDPVLDALVNASHGLVASRFKDGFDIYNSSRREAQAASWYPRLRQAKGRCLVADLLPWPNLALRVVGPSQLPQEVDWNYDALAVLQSVDVPMHWLLAHEDTEAPSGATARILQQLRSDGKVIDVDMFSPADHGLVTFDPSDSTRTPIGYHPDFFGAQLAWLKNLMGMATQSPNQ